MLETTTHVLPYSLRNYSFVPDKNWTKQTHGARTRTNPSYKLIDALHNSAFLFPVARKWGYGCINVQNSIVMAATHGQSNDLF